MVPLNSHSVHFLFSLSLSLSLHSKLMGNECAGDVSVLSSVTGPVEVRLNKELVDQATLEFNSTSLSTQSGSSRLFSPPHSSPQASTDEERNV